MKCFKNAVDKKMDAPQLTAAEELLIAGLHAMPPAQGDVLIAGNRSGCIVVEAEHTWHEACVWVHAFDVHHVRQIAHRLRDAHLSSSRVLSTPEVGGPYSTALFMTTPRSLSAELTLDYLQDIYQSLEEGGCLYASFEGSSDEALRTLHLIWKEVHVLQKARHATLFRAVKKGPLAKVRHFESAWKASVPGGEPLTFISRPGCFCHRRLDMGGLALAEVAVREIEQFPVGTTVRLLDMGCGCGLVGLLVADALRRAGRLVNLTLIDSHTRAIACARMNAAAMDFEAEFILDDRGLPRGRTGEFDLFVGNPPYYSEYRIADIFLETAYCALKKGGICLSVVKTATGLIPVQEKWFPSVDVIPRRGYSVLKSLR